MPARAILGPMTGRRFDRAAPPRSAAGRRVAIVFLAVAAAVVPADPAGATGHCATSGPIGGTYSITVCVTQPPEGATLTGTALPAATVSISGSPAPVVAKLRFELSTAYLLTDYTAPYGFRLTTARWVDGPYTLSVRAIMGDGYSSAPAEIAVTFDNNVTEPPVNTGTFVPRTGTTPQSGRPFVVAAVADAASGEANPQLVSDLVASWNPNLFLYMGDVYERGSPMEFLNWYGDPQTLFGRFRDITNPAPGNHEWDLGPGAPGYVDFWDNVPHFYSVDAAGWHVVSLDTDPRFAGTAPGSAQVEWLEQDLAASDALCTVVIAHHPRFSVGQHGDDPSLAALWSLFHGSGVDLVLTGHDHDYQRWDPLDAQGQPQPGGMTEFVVGTGGHSMYAFARSDPRLAAGFDTSPAAIGALRLELNAQGAAFRYVDAGGVTRDAGSVPCRESPADVVAPTVPANLQAVAATSTRVDLTWDPATDNVGVVGYDVFRDGQLLASVGPQLAYADGSVSPATTYTYQVRARDQAGNLSPLSVPDQVTTPAGSTVVFSDGFESGSLSGWTTVVGLTVQGTGAHSGTHAARALGTGSAAVAYASKTLLATYPELFTRVWFKPVSRSTSTNLLRLQTPAGGNVLTLFTSSSGNLMLRNDVGATNVWSSTVVPTGGWHEVQLRARVAGAASQTEVWYDGQRLGELSTTLNLGTGSLGRLMLGDNVRSRTYEVLFDDLTAAPAFVA